MPGELSANPYRAVVGNCHDEAFLEGLSHSNIG